MLVHKNDACEEKKDEGKMEGLGAKLMKARLVLVSGTVDEELAEKVMAQLLVLDAESQEPITVMITVAGGAMWMRGTQSTIR